jgi:hypothetical protein
MQNTTEYNSGKVLEKSRILDELIVAFHDLMQRKKNNDAQSQ